jgi:hypothetical protein
MRLDEVSGMRGVKQIWRSLVARKGKDKHVDDCIDEIFERHSEHFLDRCFPDWIR